jgi:hypothetical protein
MPSIIFSLAFLFLTNLLIEPTTCALPSYLQNLELDDLTSLWDKFPALIGKIKEAGMLLNNNFYQGRGIFFVNPIEISLSIEFINMIYMIN